MHTSPSALKLDSKCSRAHAYCYVLGMREPQPSWDEVKDIPRPQGADAVKAWNRKRRPALGTESHRILQLWYESFQPGGVAFDAALWQTEPGQIALQGLRLLPHPSTLESYACEEEIPEGFVSWATDGAHDYKIKAFIDLHGRDAEHVRVLDYKTTSDFRWMLTAAELSNTDGQGLVYPLHAMRKYGVEVVECAWVYFRTEQPYAARAVTFRQTLKRAKELARPLFDRGAELIERVRLKIAPEDLPSNPVACNEYGGCSYHHERGGPCHPNKGATPGQLARVKLARFNNREREIQSMAFSRSAARAAGAIDAPSSEQNNSEPATGSDESDRVEVQEESNAGSGSEEAPRQRRGRPPRSAANGSSIGVSLTFADGSTVALPESSPLYARAVAVHTALFGGE